MNSKQQVEVLNQNAHVIDELISEGHKLLLLTLGGSYAYGTNVEGSDIDIRGIYSNTESELLGMDNDKEQYTSNETDTTIYSLKKAVWLLKACNPAMIELLNCRAEDYLYVDPIGKMLMDNCSIFLSKRAAKTFGGYAKSQLNRLVNRSGRSKDLILENEKRSFEKSFLSLFERYKGYLIPNANVNLEDDNLLLSFSVENMPISRVAALLNEFNTIDRGYRKSTRNDKAAAHNKISKHMMHLVRLFMMGIELMEDQRVSTYRYGSEHDLLMSIRSGDYLKDDKVTPTDEFNKLVEDYSNRFEKACENTSLPDKPDIDKINKLLIKMNREVLNG